MGVFGENGNDNKVETKESRNEKFKSELKNEIKQDFNYKIKTESKKYKFQKNN